MIITFTNLVRGTTTRVGNRMNILGRYGRGRKLWFVALVFEDLENWSLRFTG
jgi:hypothetical protein